MRTGKVSNGVIDKYGLKRIKYRSDRIIKKPEAFNPVSVYSASVKTGESVVARSVAGITFAGKNIFFDIKRCFYEACNEVYGEWAIPSFADINVILPDKESEKIFREICDAISKLASDNSLDITGISCNVSCKVREPVITFTVTGERLYDNRIRVDCIAGDDVVISKYLGISGTLGMFYEKKDKLKERYSESYLTGIEELENYLSVSKEAVTAMKSKGVKAMYPLGNGGIYYGLSALSDKCKKGITADISKLPFYQETVEFSERLGVNPYKMMSVGSLIMITEDGETLKNNLINNDINAEVIGKLSDNKDKVFVRDEEKHYIEYPRRDEIEILLDER